YATISTYNTLARQPGRRNGGQQTNCRVNALANEALAAGRTLAIWYRVTTAEQAVTEFERVVALDDAKRLLSIEGRAVFLPLQLPDLDHIRHGEPRRPLAV